MGAPTRHPAFENAIHEVELTAPTAEGLRLTHSQLQIWIGQRLNLMEAPVRFYLPEGGVSALDAPGQAFHDPDADKALFDALEATVRQTSNRQLIRLPHNINDPEFCDEIVKAFRSLHGGNRPGRQQVRR